MKRTTTGSNIAIVAVGAMLVGSIVSISVSCQICWETLCKPCHEPLSGGVLFLPNYPVSTQ